jgi:hypothetical protein
VNSWGWRGEVGNFSLVGKEKKGGGREGEGDFSLVGKEKGRGGGGEILQGGTTI